LSNRGKSNAERVRWYRQRIAVLQREERAAKARLNGYNKRSLLRQGQIDELLKRIEKIERSKP